MPQKSVDWSWVLPISILVLVVALRLWISLDWMGNVMLVLGWGVGYVLAGADHWLYVAVCNPQELSCQRVRHELSQKNWHNAWGLLQATEGERTKLPVHNVLMAFVVSVLGLWMVTSSGSPMAVGIVLGLEVKLFSQFLMDANPGKWFWMFSREFSLQETRIAKGVWAAVVLLQLFMIVRG